MDSPSLVKSQLEMQQVAAQSSVPKEVVQEAERLRELLWLWNHQYYDLGESSVTDSEYDVNFRRLQHLEAQYPSLIEPSSPTQRVGGTKTETYRPVVHEIPMLSLDNAFNAEELRAFDARVGKLLQEAYQDEALPQGISLACESGEQTTEQAFENWRWQYVTELKIDGLAVRIVYRNRKLVFAATRGNGTTGEEVTYAAATIRQIPQVLPDWAPAELEARGEVYMSIPDFIRVNEQLPPDKKKANPRNLAAGTLRLKDSAQVAKRRLSFWAYSLETKIPGITTHAQALDYLERLGFAVCEHRHSFDTMDEVIACCSEWVQRRSVLDFEIDGVVVKVNDYSLRQVLGNVARFPRWAIAYKLPSTEVLTIVEDIIVQVGRTGVLTPVAILQPKMIDGSMISRATLHNAEELQRKDIRVGDTVFVHKAAMVIPEIIKVVMEKRPEGSQPFEMPKACPVCGGEVGHDEEEVAMRCLNPNCSGKIKNLLRLFVSRAAMDIAGLGPKLIEQLLASGLVHSVADLYLLTAQDLREHTMCAQVLSKKIMDQIEKSKSRPAFRLLTGLGIRMVGVTSAEALMEHFPNLLALSRAGAEEISQVYGVGMTVADAIVAFFADPGNLQMLEQLRQAGVMGVDGNATVLADNSPRIVGLWEEEPAEANGAAQTAMTVPLEPILKGISVVLTGTLPGMTREEASALLKARGAKIQSSVSSKTSYVIAGAEAGSKLQKARQLQIPVLDYEQMQALLRGELPEP